MVQSDVQRLISLLIAEGGIWFESSLVRQLRSSVSLTLFGAVGLPLNVESHIVHIQCFAGTQ